MRKGKKIQLAFIGCGGWAQKKYLPYISSLNDVSVVAITGIYSDQEKTAIKTLVPDVRFYEVAEKMLTNEKVDGIIMSLPHSLYCSNIESALMVKIPVLADKPASNSYKEISSLVNLAKRQNVTFAVSSQRRSFIGVKKIKKLITDRTLGRLHWLRHDFLVSSYPDWQKTWRNNPSLSGLKEKKQGILLDTGFHCVDSLLYSLNYQMPKTVLATAKYHDSAVETDAMAILEFADGLMASILVSRNMPVGYGREVFAVSGENGYFASQIEEKGKAKIAQTMYVAHQKYAVTPFLTQKSVVHPLAMFIKHLKGQPMDPIYLGKNILPTMRVLDALYQSIMTHKQVEIGAEI